jgi:Fanconi anemia group J protein
MIENLYAGNGVHLEDYNIALIKDNNAKVTQGYKLGFWCLNPGIIFRPFADASRCVILSSGTMSPISSFESELSTSFPIKLQARHVIQDNQCWVGVLGTGCRNDFPLEGTFKTVESLEYQDQIGTMLLRLTEVIPGGLLCFLPSYSLMQKIVTRWRLTGLYASLEKVKVVVQGEFHYMVVLGVLDFMVAVQYRASPSERS